MWCSRLAILIAVWVFPAAAVAGAPMSCPALLRDGAQAHALDRASVFDGPPAELADLEPQTIGQYDVWKLDDVDPFLVCRYLKTGKTIDIHAVGAKVCKAGGSPFHAVCTL